MEERNNGWLRVRGIGRERLARYVAEFLSGAGFRVEERTDGTGAAVTSTVHGTLAKPNPAVPTSFAHLEFRTSPTAGGALLRWEAPTSLAQESEKSRALRFATELSSNLEQRVALESRGQGKVTRDQPQPPFLPAPSPSPAPAPGTAAAATTPTQ
jgi:hypothetical protein